MSRKIEESEKDVLRQRVKDLEEVDSEKLEDESERLKIYLALQQYDNASVIVQKSTVLAEGTSPETLLPLAENSFLDGAKNRTKLLLSKFEPNISKQPVEWQVRFFVVKAALEPSPTVYSKEVAVLKGIDLTEAEHLLATRVDQLNKTQSEEPWPLTALKHRQLPNSDSVVLQHRTDWCTNIVVRDYRGS